MSMLNWIVFDADDTLLDFKGAQVQAFKRMMESFGLEKDSDRYLEIYRRLNDGLWRALERGEIAKAELIERRFKDFCDYTGLDGLHEKMRFSYEEELSKRGELVPGALEVCQKLSRDFPLALASNGISYIQKSRFARSGLDVFFKEVIISEETGYEKPQKGFFDVMMGRIGEDDPQRILFIGDSLNSDMLGAVNYGLLSCWYNPEKKDTDLNIDYTLTSLEQIPALVESLVIY